MHVHASCSYDGLSNPYACIRWMTSQISYLKLLITRSILSGPLDFEIKRVTCIFSQIYPLGCHAILKRHLIHPLMNSLKANCLAMESEARHWNGYSFLCFRQRVFVNGVKSDWAPVLSGVPQGRVLGPLLFSLYINDITLDTESEIRLFADDCVCYHEIKDEEDKMKLQRDIDRLGSWARKWGVRFQPVKCNMMQLTRKRIKTIHASDTLEGTDLENVESINSSHAVRDLGRVRQYPLWLLFAAFVDSVGYSRYNPQKTRKQWRMRDRRFHWLWGWFPNLKIIFMM